MSLLPIEIPKRSGCCKQNGEPFLPGQHYYSVLTREEGEETAYVRHDYCDSCWQQIKSKHGISWNSMVPIKKQESELPKRRDERALYLLKETLRDLEREGASAEAFVLALYLARRRLIVWRQEYERKGKPPISIYEVMESEEMLGVPKIALSELHIEHTRQQLAQKLYVQ